MSVIGQNSCTRYAEQLGIVRRWLASTRRVEPDLADVMQDVEHTLLAELQVPVEILLEAFPELQ
jgi:hypothetical protein